MSKSEKESRALQRRRMHAGRLLLRGVPQAEVARRVAVTRTTVSTGNERLEAATGPHEGRCGSELSLLRTLRPALPPSDVLLADAVYCN